MYRAKQFLYLRYILGSRSSYGSDRPALRTKKLSICCAPHHSSYRIRLRLSFPPRIIEFSRPCCLDLLFSILFKCLLVRISSLKEERSSTGDFIHVQFALKVICLLHRAMTFFKISYTRLISPFQGRS